MKIEKTSATINSAIDEVLNEYNLSFSDIEYEVLQEPSKGFLGFGKKLAKVVFTIKKEALEKDKFDKENNNSIKTLNNNFIEEDVKVNFTQKETNKNAPEVARKFLTEIFNSMELEIEMDIQFIEEKKLLINLTGDNIGVIIGKRGQTLDSLQYLVNLVINKGDYAYVSIEMDTSEYRRKRKEALETLANNLAKKVRKTNKVVKLEPMNSYERKIIHNVLKIHTDIKTFSEGQEPFRYVVIVPKK